MKIGLLGAGNMGTALIKGYIASNPGSENNVFAYDIIESSLNSLVDSTGINKCTGPADLASKSDVIIIAVKPNVFTETLSEVVVVAGWEEKILVSIAAGISLKYIWDQCKDQSGFLGRDEDFNCKIVRVMPNTPALIGKGVSALTKNPMVTTSEFENILKIFSSIGIAEEVDEALMDSVVGISGSGPAYVYMFIEAMADGAVAMGMSRKQAYAFAAQTVAGSAEMVLKTGLHPGELKDRVCSPGGTTIEAVGVLEEKGFRSAVATAVKTATEKSTKMTK